MAIQHSQDAVVKQRIIPHMNADHQDSIVRYLEHLLNVSSFLARNARIEDMTLDSITVRSSGKRYLIPLEPPMDSWRDARERLVRMDKDAIEALGRSDITVKEYKRPEGFLGVVFVTCAATFVAFCRKANFLPGSFLYEVVLKHVPWFASFCAKIQPVLFYTMVAIHVGEVIKMVNTRLRKHSVPVACRLWWMWVLSAFIEGFGAFKRFDAIVKAKTAEKETKKH
ncbi:putative integral membrane protein [Glonium stellatum]|uniref:Putative integral membrane protein n=1 Tax=Glonium stellatum TaxID=574774 RepID=A0A8E2FCK7_9PEZI|nr:putative integral membrane protein [Glonium stellatum]